jgi:peroxiredoxin
MKIIILLYLIAISLNVSGQRTSTNKKLSAHEEYLKTQSDKYVGKKYPEFSLKTNDSFAISNKDLANKVVFINFWSEHCSPCIAETDGFNQMFDKLKDNSNFIFVSFSSDSDTTIKRLIKKFNIRFRVIHLDKDEYSKLNFNNGIPTSFILDKNGIIKYFRCGGPDEIDIATKTVMTEFYPRILEYLSH